MYRKINVSQLSGGLLMDCKFAAITKNLASVLLFSLLGACSSDGLLPFNANEDKAQQKSSVTSVSHQQQTSSDIDRRYAALLALYAESGKEERDLERAQQLTEELKMAYPPDHDHQEILALLEAWTTETLAEQDEINALKQKVWNLQQELVRQEQALEMIRRSLVIQ